MAKKRKTDPAKTASEPPQLPVMRNGRSGADEKVETTNPPAAKKKKTGKKSAPADSESDTSGILDTSIKTETDFEEVNINLPPKEDLSVLLNRIEMQLPKDDHVKYDSR